jgi:hypothetical protein
MPKRVKTRKNADVNQIAAAIVALTDREQEPEKDTRNAAAVALGKLGASKGGKTRAKKLSKKQRAAIAKKAARKRWGKRRAPIGG